MNRGYLVTGARCALGLVVSVATFGTLGACGGRYELGEDAASGGKAGAGGKATTGGTGGSVTGSGGSGGTGEKGGGTGGGGTGGTELSTGGTGGDGATGGTGNVGGTPSGFVSQIRTQSNKLDLLLMVDNSISMGDKQELLAQAVPYLMRRLTTPQCVDDNGAPLGALADELGVCEEGAPEFPPLRDIHIGVITSSLGDHGSGDVCSQAANDGTRHYDDRAQLLPTVRSQPNPDPRDFLLWDPSQQAMPPGISTLNDLVVGVQSHVRAAGERGCGYEASLESWYRFLVDPEPILEMQHGLEPGVGADISIRGAVNAAILEQRAAFLRPDSQVAIIMLSDENDCSILDEDGTQGWLVPFKGGPSANSWRMPRSNSACAEDPNGPNCGPCGLPGDEDDPACSQGGPLLTMLEDAPNLRCFQQKKRFGIDLLYPTERYVQALTSFTIDPRFTGRQVPNPLFAGGRRGPASVVLMGILGVPWQDLAKEESLGDAPLSYMTSAELIENQRWDMIVGDGRSAPSDPFMVESIDPREVGTPHPVLGATDAVMPPSSTVMNRINGTERLAPSARDDLQYACIFPLVAPKDCTNPGTPCDCDEEDVTNPICTFQEPTVQVYGKAYPSTRQLEVLKALGDSGVATSICPKDTPSEENTQGPGWGYNPNMAALVDRMKREFAQLCLPREFEVEADGQIACRIVEASLDSCDCSAPGRSPVASGDLAAARSQLALTGVCGDGTGVSCDPLCACEVQQLEGSELDACKNEALDPGNVHGFCYVDPAADSNANPALVAGCPATQKRFVRFMGEGVPSPDMLTIITCDPE